MRGRAAFIAAVIGVVALCGTASAARRPHFTGIHKIRHIVVIMQENRSFDSYFGTYPGADGIPKHVCVPDPAHGGCLRPYHDRSAVNFGGPHDHIDAVKDVSAGAMSGFVAQAEAGRRMWCTKHIDAPACSLSPKKPDVMGYHDWHELPNYWTYARHFVLEDHMFQADASWSLPGHLYMVSGWSAKCSQRGNPMSCVNAVQATGFAAGRAAEHDRRDTRLRVD